MRRIHPSIAPIRTFNGNEVTGELFFFRHTVPADIEVSLASHLIILLPDGVSGVCECNSDDRIDTFHSIAPNTVIFNPAKKYLHLRITKTQSQWRLLHLTIEPAVLRELGEDELQQLNDELRTQIDADDPAASKALLAILREIEKPKRAQHVIRGKRSDADFNPTPEPSIKTHPTPATRLHSRRIGQVALEARASDH
jgi:hypothetical protein